MTTRTDPGRPLGPPLANLALSRSDIDRRSDLRSEPGLLARLLGDQRTRVLPLADGRAPVGAGGTRLGLRSPADGDDARTAAYLGEDADGVSYVTVRVAEPAESWLGLREVGATLDDRAAGLFAQALALANWHSTHPRCPRCGAPTESAQAGWTRVCTSEGSEHYPRTDPAVIMAVVDGDDRLLLGHGAAWPRGRFSTLAGFVEPGESLEAAVRREVEEEVGVRIGDVIYRGSQPWPFPASVMLGFRAYATTTEIDCDGSEVDDARWFTRESLTAAIDSGEVLMSPTVSIARRLIEDWYGEPIPARDTDIWRPPNT